MPIDISVTMNHYICRTCGIPFGLPASFITGCDQRKVLCPNGHRFSDGKDAVEAARGELASALGVLHRYRQERDDYRARVGALKGVITRMKRARS